MQVNYYSTVLFLAAVCWWFGGALAQSQLLNEERLLELHNRARSSVSPPASFMFKMVTFNSITIIIIIQDSALCAHACRANISVGKHAG